MEIAQNGKGSGLFGDVAGQPKPMCYPEGIWRSRQVDDRWWIHLDTEEIVKASCSLFQHDCAIAFKLSERSPLPPALSAKDLPGGRTQILNIRRIRRFNRHPVVSDKDSAQESISDTDDWLNWNGDLDSTNYSEDDYPEDNEFDIEQNNGIGDSECS